MKRKMEPPASSTPTKTVVVDSRGYTRVYIDLPPDIVRRFNIMAATRGQPKRTLLAELVRNALIDAEF